MSDPNFAQQAGEFAVDAEVDSTVDNLVNQTIETVASHIPGEQMFDQALRTEVDQVVNNEINAQLDERLGGLFGRGENQGQQGQ